jgi:hypothetical protein
MRFGVIRVKLEGGRRRRGWCGVVVTVFISLGFCVTYKIPGKEINTDEKNGQGLGVCGDLDDARGTA